MWKTALFVPRMNISRRFCPQLTAAGRCWINPPRFSRSVRDGRYAKAAGAVVGTTAVVGLAVAVAVGAASSGDVAVETGTGEIGAGGTGAVVGCVLGGNVT